VRLEKRFSRNLNLTYREERMRYPKMCHTVHSTHKKVLQVNHYLYFLIQRKDKLALALLSGIFALLCLPASLLIRLCALLFVTFKKPVNPAKKYI
jgi:hypothetical protein